MSLFYVKENQVKQRRKFCRNAIYIPLRGNIVEALVHLTSVKSLIKTNQSVSNILLQHLGPFLNCKFVGTRWRASCCSRIIYSVGRAARLCERVSLRTTALSCCLLQSSLINGSPCDEPTPSFTEGQRRQGEARSVSSSILVWDQRDVVDGSQFHVCQPCGVLEPVLKCKFDLKGMVH